MKPIMIDFTAINKMNGNTDVYYKKGDKFVTAKFPSMYFRVEKDGYYVVYETTDGMKRISDFYVKSADGRYMNPVPTTCDHGLGAVSVNKVNGYRDHVCINEQSSDDTDKVELYVTLYGTDGNPSARKFKIEPGTYKCESNGFSLSGHAPYSPLAWNSCDADVGIDQYTHGFRHIDDAKFFTSLQVEGEERIPSYAERVVLPQDLAKKAMKILEKAFKDVQKLGVVLGYSNCNEMFYMIKDPGTEIRQGENCDSDVRDDVFIPDSAWTEIPHDVTPFKFLGECYGLIMKK